MCAFVLKRIRRREDIVTALALEIALLLVGAFLAGVVFVLALPSRL